MAATLVSFCKREVFETVPGLMCAYYRIAKSESNVKPETLVVEDSHYHKPDIDGTQDAVFVPANQIAESIVAMHVSSQLGYRPNYAHPALFFIPDVRLEAMEVVQKYAPMIRTALERQHQWFVELVRMADDDWQQAHRYQMVSDIQRTAARELKIERDWLEDFDRQKVGCPFCGEGLLNPDAPICPSCKQIHNPVKHAELIAKMNATLAKASPAATK